MPIQKITSGVLEDGAIATADIADGSVTAIKLAPGAGGQAQPPEQGDGAAR
jgi:hypothetical protein